MAQETALSYNVSRNGSAGDWYWEVMSGRQIIARGLAPTKAQARTEARKVTANHGDQCIVPEFFTDDHLARSDIERRPGC
jgi:hypothetical protein